MNKFILRQSLLLLLTATIWGVAFVAQSVGMDYVGPFTFNVMRSIIGGVVLLPCIALLGKINGKGNTEAAKKMDGKERKTLFIGGIACGVLLCIASNLQQFGIMYTSVGKAGFITAMYIVVVPVLGKKVSGKVWCGVGIAVAGLYLLCMTESGFSVQKGDFLLMLASRNAQCGEDRLYHRGRRRRRTVAQSSLGAVLQSAADDTSLRFGQYFLDGRGELL